MHGTLKSTAYCNNSLEYSQITLVYNRSLHLSHTLTATITLLQSIYMSWLRGKKTSVTNLKAEELQLSRSTTPTPRNPEGNDDKVTFRSGLLTIRVFGAEGVALPPGTALPLAVQQALASQQGKIAASVSPSSVNQQRLLNKSRGNRCVSMLRHSMLISKFL